MNKRRLLFCFTESMAEAGKSVSDYLGSETLQVRVRDREDLHTLEYAGKIGLGSHAYELVNIDD